MAIEGSLKCKKRYKQYLIDQGYKEYTPKGHPSTVDDYVRRVDRVCKSEGLTWTQLTENIRLLTVMMLADRMKLLVKSLTELSLMP